MKSSLLKSLLVAFIILIVLSVVMFVPEENFLLHADSRTVDDEVLAKINKVRVLCWVMTAPSTIHEKAAAIEKTWGRRCDKLLLMSSRTQNITSDNVIALPVDEGRGNLWRKFRAAYKYVYENHFEEADWFMKTDDDAYVVMDNLRYMLYQYSPTFPVYFGYRFKPYTKQGYMAGVSVVLSKEALHRFMNQPDADSPCNVDIEAADDVQIGICLDKVGVVAGDSRDHRKSERFFPFEPDAFIVEKGFDVGPWIRDFMYYTAKEGIDTPSDTAIAFHYISPAKMFLFEYLLYHLRPVGRSKSSRIILPEKLTFEEMMAHMQEAEKDKNLDKKREAPPPPVVVSNATEGNS